MTKNYLIIITGPSASGKSTVAKLLCKKYKKCVRLDIDRVKHFIETGFVYDESKEGKKQWKLCTENVILLTKNYLKNGYTVIIEGVLGSIDDSSEWKTIFKEFNPKYKYLLSVSRSNLNSRNKTRDKRIQLSNKDIDRHFKKFGNKFYKKYFEIIENEDLKKTVNYIYEK